MQPMAGVPGCIDETAAPLTELFTSTGPQDTLGQCNLILCVPCGRQILPNATLLVAKDAFEPDLWW